VSIRRPASAITSDVTGTSSGETNSWGFLLVIRQRSLAGAEGADGEEELGPGQELAEAGLK
jgi:hypothetical protein